MPLISHWLSEMLGRATVARPFAPPEKEILPPSTKVVGEAATVTAAECTVSVWSPTFVDALPVSLLELP